MILDGFHAGQDAAVWLLAFLVGFALMLAPVAALAALLWRHHLARRLHVTLAERRARRG